MLSGSSGAALHLTLPLCVLVLYTCCEFFGAVNIFLSCEDRPYMVPVSKESWPVFRFSGWQRNAVKN